MFFESLFFVKLVKIFSFVMPLALPVALLLMARYLTRRDKARADAADKVDKDTKETAAERKLWRESRLNAENSLHEAITKESSERTQWQLKREAESALVAGILEESTEAHKLLASIASTTRHLEGASAELKSDMRELRQHVNTMQSQLITLHNSHAKP